MVNFKAFIDIIGRANVGKAVNKAVRSMKSFKKKSQEVNRNMRGTSRVAKHLSQQSGVPGNIKQVRSFVNQQSEMLNKFKRVSNSSKQAGKQAALFGNATRRASDETIGFQANMLSLMFAGMALKGVFNTMFGPISKTMGVGKLFGSMLKSVMLPVMSALMPVLINIATWFMNLSPITKKIIGYIVLLAGIFGTLIAFIGMTVLAVIAMWNTVPAIIIGIIAAALAIFTTILSAAEGWGDDIISFFKNTWNLIISTVKPLVNSIIALFKGLWGMIVTAAKKGIELFINVIKGIKGAFQGVIDTIVGIFTGDFDKAVEGIKNIIDGIVTFMTAGFVDDFSGVLETIGGYIKDLFQNPIETVKDTLDTVISKLKSVASGAKNAFSKLPFFGGDGSSGGASSGGRYNDFLLRNGKITHINPRDTVVGFKGDSPVGGGNVSINVNVDNVSNDVDIREIADEIEDRLDTKYRGRNF